LNPCRFNQQNQWNIYRQPQNRPEPMEIDESIQKVRSTKKNETRNSQRVTTGTVNQPANKKMRLDNIEEDHFLDNSQE